MKENRGSLPYKGPIIFEADLLHPDDFQSCGRREKPHDPAHLPFVPRQTGQQVPFEKVRRDDNLPAFLRQIREIDIPVDPFIAFGRELPQVNPVATGIRRGICRWAFRRLNFCCYCSQPRLVPFCQMHGAGRQGTEQGGAKQELTSMPDDPIHMISQFD